MWKVRDRFGLVGGPLERFDTCRGTHEEVRDGSGDPRGDPGPVEGPTGKSGTGRGTLEEVRGTHCEDRGTH